MTFVVTEACNRCEDTACVDVRPVDAFRERADFLVIDPDERIGCAVCVTDGPANAMPAARTRTELALPDADACSKIERKLDLVKR